MRAAVVFALPALASALFAQAPAKTPTPAQTLRVVRAVISQSEDGPALASNLIYFSFVTLTSTGFGDIVPLHPLARSLCNVEGIIGQLFPATLLARLVSLEVVNARGTS